MTAAPLRLRLPATSANLGPGFDALGLAMKFSLHVEVEPAEEMSLLVTGRDSGRIQDASTNLVLTTCRSVLDGRGQRMPDLSVHLHNEIPLGMGCGSSAAALVAGVALANHAGNLQWTDHEVLVEAARREGHPDNVAACVLGGFTASAMRGTGVDAIALQPPVRWQLLLVMPPTRLSTRTARGLLPPNYSRADAVSNVQNTALLTAAFATGNASLLRDAMNDRMHQPYRLAVCPLLACLLPLAGQGDVLGVALSGAGPSVLLVVQQDAERNAVETLVRAAMAGEPAPAELLWTEIAGPAVLK